MLCEASWTISPSRGSHVFTANIPKGHRPAFTQPFRGSCATKALCLCLSFSLSLFLLSLSFFPFLSPKCLSVWHVHVHIHTSLLPSLQLFFFLCELSLKGTLSLSLFSFTEVLRCFEGVQMQDHISGGWEASIVFLCLLCVCLKCLPTITDLMSIATAGGMYIESMKQQWAENTFSPLNLQP